VGASTQNKSGAYIQNNSRATAPKSCYIACFMADLHIVRGPAPLPVNVEDQFRRAYGRDMNKFEREFYGLGSQTTTEADSHDLPKAA